MADSSDLVATISDLEDQTWQALTVSGTKLLPYLAADCTMQLPFGLSITSSSTPSIKDTMTSDAFIPWSKYRISDVTVSPVGAEGAVIGYRVKADREGEKFRALVCSVWRKESGDETWKMCFHQQTPFDAEIEDLV